MTYEESLIKSRIASKAYREASEAYRLKLIGDSEFIEARSAYNASNAEFDAAFKKEQDN